MSQSSANIDNTPVVSKKCSDIFIHDLSAKADVKIGGDRPWDFQMHTHDSAEHLLA